METPIKFNLHKGMKGQEVLAELNGKVSGETRELYQAFAQPGPHHVMNEDPLHRVIADDGKYAIIEKIHTTAKIMHSDGVRQQINEFGVIQYDSSDRPYKTIVTDRSYFLTGINDEGTYFVHPMDEESIKYYWKTGSVPETLDVINKVADGYTRMQGDVLVKFIPEYEIVWEDNTPIVDIGMDRFSKILKRTPQEIKTEIDREREMMMYSLPSRGYGMRSREQTVDTPDKYFEEGSDESKEFSDKKGFFGASSLTFEEYEKEYLKYIDTPMAISTPKEKRSHPIPLFGNHFLYEGKGQVYEDRGTVLVMGEQKLFLDHNEHKAITINVPLGHAAVLTTQRGVTAIEGRRVGFD